MANILLSKGYKYNANTDRYEKIEGNKETYIKRYGKHIQVTKVINEVDIKLMNTFNIKDEEINFIN